MPNDPLITAFAFGDIRFNMVVCMTGLAATIAAFAHKLDHPHMFITYKGPDNPWARIRHRRFPAGGWFYGWGNNGLNRDCNMREYECWAGYMGKEYTY